MNSTNLGARLTSQGSASVSSDDLTLTIRNIAPNKSGIVFAGPNQLAVPFGDGLRCVGGQVVRFPVRQSDANGIFVESNIASQLGASSGQTWNLQGWYRDPAGPCLTGFNLTSGLSASFLP